MMRLNNSITQLNNSIVRLTNTNARHVQPQASHQSQMPGIPVASGKSMDSFGAVGSITDRVVENEVRIWVKHAIKNKDATGWTSQLLDKNPASGIFGGVLGSDAQRAKFQEMFGGMTWNELNNPNYRKHVDEFLNPGKNEKMNPLYARTMQMMLGGQVLGQFANLGQQHLEMTPEYSRYASVVGAFQNVGQMAAFGSVLGPTGMLGGAAIGML